MFFSRKRLLHIGFKKALCPLLTFIKRMWEHPINNNLKYEMIYLRPINERNMFYYIFFQKKNID